MQCSFSMYNGAAQAAFTVYVEVKRSEHADIQSQADL